MRIYMPWIWAFGFAALMVAARLMTNALLRHSLRGVPRSVSLFYLVGFLGLGFTVFWSIWTIAWWAFLPVMAIYGLTCLVPSEVARATQDPKIAHLAAIEQAGAELAQIEPGPGKLDMVMKRADEIMQSQGWKPNS